jgi:hypothetical protein
LHPTDELTIRSRLHGRRVWRRVGERDHLTRDDRRVTLAIWETPCVVCGEAFQVAVTSRCGRTTHAFMTTTCPAHRRRPNDPKGPSESAPCAVIAP